MMPKNLDISNDRRTKDLLQLIWEEYYGHFQTIWSPSFYSEEVYSQVEDIQNRHADPPRSGRPRKFTPRSNRVTLREMTDNPRTSPQTLQASVNMFNCKVHDSTIRKIWDKHGMFWRLARRKPLLYCLCSQSYIWTNHKTSRTMCFEQMRPKWWCLAINVTHAGGGLMILGLFCSHWIWTPHSHWVNHELLCIPEHARVKCDAIRPTAKIGSCNRTMIPSTPANLQQNGWKIRESRCCNIAKSRLIQTQMLWWELCIKNAHKLQ